MLAWGGKEEQTQECVAGNWNAKNWQDEACQILEQAVGIHLLHTDCLPRWRNTGKNSHVLVWLPQHLVQAQLP